MWLVDLNNCPEIAPGREMSGPPPSKRTRVGAVQAGIVNPYNSGFSAGPVPPTPAPANTSTGVKFESADFTITTEHTLKLPVHVWSLLERVCVMGYIVGKGKIELFPDPSMKSFTIKQTLPTIKGDTAPSGTNFPTLPHTFPHSDSSVGPSSKPGCPTRLYYPCCDQR